MKLWTISPMEYPIFQVYAYSESEARTVARLILNVEKLPKGTLVTPLYDFSRGEIC